MPIKNLYNRTRAGMGAMVIIALVIAVILLMVSMAIQMNNKKTIELSISGENNLRTYYAAMAGINECIATRMMPRSNVIVKRKKITASQLSRLNRVNDSGLISFDLSGLNTREVIGEYTYIAYIVNKDSKGSSFITEDNSDRKTEKYMVYSVGSTNLPNGQVDSVVIKAVFDLNRNDSDPFSADEIEEFKVLPSSDIEAQFAEKLIKENLADKVPPMVREVKFTVLNGDKITAAISDQDDKKRIEALYAKIGVKEEKDSLIIEELKKFESRFVDIGINSHIEIKFTKPIDPNYLDGIRLKNLNNGRVVKDIDKIVISPNNYDLDIMPAKKSNGKFLDYGSDYELEMSGVSDFNGNILPDGPVVFFRTQKKPKDIIDNKEDTVYEQKVRCENEKECDEKAIKGKDPYRPPGSLTKDENYSDKTNEESVKINNTVRSIITDYVMSILYKLKKS